MIIQSKTFILFLTQIQLFSLSFNLLLLFVISLIIILLCASLWILWQHQTHKEEQQSQAFVKLLFENVEQERDKIAYDLHESIGHELLNLKNDLKSSLTAKNEKIELILKEVRSISRNLHPVLFEKVGLVISLFQLIEHFQEKEDLFVSAEVNYKEKTLSFYAELQIYRIIQEVLSNVSKYAQAHAAKVSINTSATHVIIEIKDNGKGFKVKETLKKGRAFGLLSILERAKTIEGKAIIDSNANGTTVSMKIPISKK